MGTCIVITGIESLMTHEGPAITIWRTVPRIGGNGFGLFDLAGRRARDMLPWQTTLTRHRAMHSNACIPWQPERPTISDILPRSSQLVDQIIPLP
jgi:hypothetical protein